jgi:hypothetical protein
MNNQIIQIGFPIEIFAQQKHFMGAKDTVRLGFPGKPYSMGAIILFQYHFSINMLFFA